MSVYFAQRRKGGLIKIGCSQNVMFRVKGFRAKLIGTVPGDRSAERSLHKQFAHLRIRGEWFSPGEELMLFIQTEAQKHLPDSGESPLQVRMRESTIARIQAYQQRLHQETGFRISFSKVACSLLGKALDAAKIP